jgi:hypothetical protein
LGIFPNISPPIDFNQSVKEGVDVMESLYIAYNDVCDSARANHVRKQLLASKRYLIEGYMPFTTWSKTKLGTSTEQIKSSIEEGLERSAATLVLVGPDSAANPWIRYAIERTYNAQKPMLALFINKLKDEHGNTDTADVNPLERFAVLERGKKVYLSERYAAYGWSDLSSGEFEAWLELARQKSATKVVPAQHSLAMPNKLVSDSVPELDTTEM